MIRDFGLSASRHHAARVQASHDAVPSGESDSGRDEELLGCLLCVTARGDAFAPTGIVGAARDPRPNRSVGEPCQCILGSRMQSRVRRCTTPMYHMGNIKTGILNFS
jgi:hypothetical protein